MTWIDDQFPDDPGPTALISEDEPESTPYASEDSAIYGMFASIRDAGADFMDGVHNEVAYSVWNGCDSGDLAGVDQS